MISHLPVKWSNVSWQGGVDWWHITRKLEGFDLGTPRETSGGIPRGYMAISISRSSVRGGEKCRCHETKTDLSSVRDINGWCFVSKLRVLIWGGVKNLGTKWVDNLFSFFMKGPLLTFTTGHSNPLVWCLGRAQCLLIADFQYIHSAMAREFFFARKWLWVPNGHRPKRRCQISVRQRWICWVWHAHDCSPRYASLKDVRSTAKNYLDRRSWVRHADGWVKRLHSKCWSMWLTGVLLYIPISQMDKCSMTTLSDMNKIKKLCFPSMVGDLVGWTIRNGLKSQWSKGKNLRGHRFWHQSTHQLRWYMCSTSGPIRFFYLHMTDKDDVMCILSCINHMVMHVS